MFVFFFKAPGSMFVPDMRSPAIGQENRGGSQCAPVSPGTIPGPFRNVPVVFQSLVEPTEKEERRKESEGLGVRGSGGPCPLRWGTAGAAGPHLGLPRP